MYKLFIEDSQGERIELLEAEDEKVIEGAKHGSKALLELFSDDLELDDEYQVYYEKEQSSFL